MSCTRENLTKPQHGASSNQEATGSDACWERKKQFSSGMSPQEYRLPIFQEMVLHLCTYRQHYVDSGSLEKEHTKLRGKSDRVEGSSGETGEKKHNVKC